MTEQVAVPSASTPAAPAATKAAAPAAKPAAKVATAKKPPSSSADLDAEKRLAAAANAILKSTGKEKVKSSRAPRPHVSSGSFLIDHIIGGSISEDGKGFVCPGFPRKCLTEIFGPEASGKTTAALEAVAAVQKLPGGTVLYLDFEKALDQRYARSIGVDFDRKILCVQPDTLEEGWQMIRIGLRSGVDLIVVDSVAAMVPAAELAKKENEPAKIGAVASALSTRLPRLVSWLNNKEESKNPLGTAVVFINQGRAQISTGGPSRGGGNEHTTGGKALPYYMSLRLMFTRIGSEDIVKKSPLTGKEQRYRYGNHTRVKVVKTKIDGTGGHTTDIFIRHGHGIDNVFSLLEAAVACKVVQRSGGTNKYGSYVAPSKDKFRELLRQNTELFEEIKTKTLAVVRDGASGDAPDEDADIEELLQGAYAEGAAEIVEGSDFTDDDAGQQEAEGGEED